MNNEQLTEKEKKTLMNYLGEPEDRQYMIFEDNIDNFLEIIGQLLTQRVALAKQEAVFTKYELELIERLLGDLCTENWVELKLSSKTVKDIEKMLDKIEGLTSGGGKAE